MDLLQRKLNKSEWNSIEIPVSKEEQNILNLIKSGYHNVNVTHNNTLSLLKYLKITPSPTIHQYVFTQYLQPIIKNITEKYNLAFHTVYKEVKKTMKKADLIRFSNTDKNLDSNKKELFEYIVLDLLDIMFKFRAQKKEKWIRYYYTVKILIDYDVELFNKTLQTLVKTIINNLENEIDIAKLIGLGQEIIEQNNYLLKYANIELYEHQKRLFSERPRGDKVFPVPVGAI